MSFSYLPKPPPFFRSTGAQEPRSSTEAQEQKGRSSTEAQEQHRSTGAAQKHRSSTEAQKHRSTEAAQKHRSRESTPGWSPRVRAARVRFGPGGGADTRLRVPRGSRAADLHAGTCNPRQQPSSRKPGERRKPRNPGNPGKPRNPRTEETQETQETRETQEPKNPGNPGTQETPRNPGTQEPRQRAGRRQAAAGSPTPIAGSLTARCETVFLRIFQGPRAMDPPLGKESRPSDCGNPPAQPSPARSSPSLASQPQA